MYTNCNHFQITPHIMNYGKVDPTSNSLKFPLSRPCNNGEQCYLSYGNLSSSHLITFYGFLPKGDIDNPYDVIPLGNIFFYLNVVYQEKKKGIIVNLSCFDYRY